MLALTRKADYALVALTYLGRLQRQQAGPVSARQIASQFDLPTPLLSNVLKDLAQAKLVSSTRGPSGGYELAGDPQRTTLMEIITAVEGPVQLSLCTDSTTGLSIMGQGCSHENCCPIRSPIRRLHQRIANMLEQMTLADLMEPPPEAPEPPEAENLDHAAACHVAAAVK
ncbi:MAG: Rrf2 family transcriptional regulator [Phycisphaeraceae bacterium]|nr:Rrf2 family transcriptional regulator [Phycisphaeraceae bacterium]